jgi:hypothetical protein
MPKTIKKEEEVKTINKETVEQNIIQLLGTPKNFSHVNAVHLFDNRWRVNVYDKTPGFIEKRTITDSFYCIVTKNGEISSPNIEKKY